MAKFKKIKSKNYPTQLDTDFLVHILTEDTVEVRTIDRDDYAVMEIPKSLVRKLTTKKVSMKDMVNTVYIVKAEDVVLETESGVRGLLHYDHILSKVKKSGSSFKVKRSYYPNGDSTEVSTHPVKPSRRFTDTLIEN